MSKNRIVPVIQVGGGAPKGPVGKVHATLAKVAFRATELGRDSIAIAAIGALRDLSGSVVTGTSISNSVFNLE